LFHLRGIETGMATNLRRATLADAATIRDLTRRAYAKWVPLIGREPKPMTVNYDKAVIDHMIDLYEIDGEVFALIEVIPQEQQLLIENIAVRPDHQGKRIGELLLKHAESIARSLHLAELQLYTNAAFISNIEFYARRGFQEFRRVPFHAGGVTVQMKKIIGPV
jgi:N-acetylglutamate synthase-like GNAT family acetyltransferase